MNMLTAAVNALKIILAFSYERAHNPIIDCKSPLPKEPQHIPKLGLSQEIEMKVVFEYQLELGELKDPEDLTEVTALVSEVEGGYEVEVIKVSLLICGVEINVANILTEKSQRFLKEEAIGIYADAARIARGYSTYKPHSINLRAAA